MALTKVQYTDNVTVIGAKNLNDIQDEVIANGNNISNLDTNKVDKVQGKGLSTNDFTTENLQKLNGIETGATRVIVDAELSEESENALQNKVATDAIKAVDDKVLALTETITDSVTGLDTKAPAIYETASGSIASFSDGADDMPLKSLTVNIEPVQAGSGDPSPTNVRPISGWTGANVSRTGKNLLDANNYQAGIAITTGGITTQTADRYSYYISVKEGEIFTFSAADRGTSTYFWICTYATEPNVAGVEAVSYSDNISGTDRTVTIPNGAKYLCLFFGAGVMVDPQLELGSTATSYEPYQGTTFPITFPTEAGTVYGGTLTINSDGSADLIVKTMKYTITGTETNYSFAIQQTSGGNSVLKVITSKGGIKNNENQICNYASYNVRAWEASASRANTFVVAAEGNVYLQLPTSVAATVDNYKTLFATNPLEILSELDTPITYQLTPQQLTTLLGTNNIWADTGDVDVTYPADTKLFIQNVNKPIDDDMTADTQIASGKYFIIGNTLYLSTTVIPAGDTIIPGTNCQQTNLAEALNALNT